MRFIAPRLAALMAVWVATPLSAQQLGAPADPRPAAQKPAKPKVQPASRTAAKAKPQPAQTAGGGRQPKWEDAPLPKPLPGREEFSWPPSTSGVRPTLGSGGGGMAIGF
jgi:hypothetical protein